MGACGSHIRTKATHFTSKHPYVAYRKPETPWVANDSIQIIFSRISDSDELVPSTPELTNVNKITDLQFFPTKKQPLSTSKVCLFELSPCDFQICGSSTKFVAKNVSIGKEKEDSVKIALDDSSTFSNNSAKECSLVGQVETEPYLANQQSQVIGFDATSLPPEIGEYLRNLVNTDNPEVKAVAAKLIGFITNLSTLENSQGRQVVHMLSRSLSQNICSKENIVDITGEPADPKIYHLSNRTSTSAESEQVLPHCGFFELLDSKSVGSDTVLSVSDSFCGSGETTVCLEGDEKIEKSTSPDIDMVEFSKRQVMRSHRESMQMSEILVNMPSLTQSLAKTKKASQKDSCMKNCDDIFQNDWEDLGLDAISTRIDELDVEISKSTQKLTELRGRSLDLLIGEGDSGAYHSNGKKLSFVSGEQEIIRWQDHKNKLVDERNQIVLKLHSKLCDKINTTPLIYSPTKSGFSHIRDTSLATATDTEMKFSGMKSDSMTVSFSTVSNQDLPDIVAEAELGE